jgi:hypothetical protein
MISVKTDSAKGAALADISNGWNERWREAELQAMFLDGTLRRNEVDALLVESQIVTLVQANLQIGS